MWDTVLVDLSGIATLITAIATGAIVAKVYPFSRMQLAGLVFLVSLGCLLGSLYMSDVLNLPPCDLCWWQRIFIYPTVVISAVALIKKNTTLLFTNVAALSTIGLGFALLNIYIQSVPNATTLYVCDPKNPCSEIDVIALGFLTLPMMSAVAYLFFLACAWAAARTPDNRMEISHE